MSFVVTGLTGGEVHFALRSSDEAGHQAGMSNPVSAVPGEGVLLTEPSLDILGGTTADTFTYEVGYVYPAAPATAEVLIDGTAYAMSAVPGKADEIRYRYQTTLAKGQHDYQFRFTAADAEVPVAETPLATGPVVGAVVFTIGSNATTNPADPDFEPGRRSDEWQHTVVLTDSVLAAVTEVTQAEWEALGLTNPSAYVGATGPVDSVTWDQAAAYCNALSLAEGLDPAYTINGPDVTWDRAADGWRLPTEAEWEWLCRAGTTTSLAGGPLVARVCNLDPVLDSLGWYCGNIPPGTPGPAPVGGKAANAFGLYDMHGNVWEWCWDWYGDYRQGDVDGDGVVLDPTGPAVGTQRSVRGGSWYGNSEDCRSASRGARYPDSAEDVVGLRVVRTLFSD